MNLTDYYMEKFALSPAIEAALAGSAIGETSGIIHGVLRHKKNKLKETALEHGAMGAAAGTPLGVALYGLSKLRRV